MKRRRPRKNAAFANQQRSVEILEERTMLSAKNVFAQFEGVIDSNGPEEINISIASDAFTLSGGRTLLGFHVLPAPGTSLDPGAAEIHDSLGGRVPTRYSRSDNHSSSDSVVIAELGLGNFTLQVPSERGTVGAFQLEVFLVGDLNGNGQTALSESTQLRRMFGARAGSGSYRVEADANLDGRIGAIDLAYARLNSRDATTIRPLTTLSSGVSPSPITLPSGLLATVVASSQIVGQTIAGGSVSLDTNGDGLFDNGSTVADGNGAFTMPVTLVEGDNVIDVRVADSFGQRLSTSVSVILDTTGPTAPGIDLDPLWDSSPVGDHRTLFDAVTLSGTTDPGAQVRLEPLGVTVLANETGRFDFHQVPLTLGENAFTVWATDPFGRENTSQKTIRRLESERIVLSEGEAFAIETSRLIPLGQAEGSRTLRFQVDAAFDPSDNSAALEDIFLVYLVDPADATATLLDHGERGSAIFSLAGEKSEFVPGQVKYDGSVVEVDLTSLGNRAEGRFLFQLLNSDSDSGSRVIVSSITNEVDTEGFESPVFPMGQRLVNAGSPLDLSSFLATSEVTIDVENVRFDSTTGRYAAEIRARNLGPSTGRQFAVAFPGLPAGVRLLNASGMTTADNSPYVNLTPSIPFGGLSKNGVGDAVLLEFENPANQRFSLRPVVYSGGANRVPTFAPISPQTIMPGGVLEIPLLATDPDGDPISFSLGFESGQSLPTGVLRADRVLEFRPELDQLGSYQFDVIATDGAADVRQAVTLSVVPDPNTTTRISGIVKNTLDRPLAGVPVEIGGFSGVTKADGSFTITLPTMKVPTESFNIPIPQGDPLFDPSNTGTQEIRFRRARHDVTTGDSVTNPRQHPNLVTSFLDAGVVYGSDLERAAALRTFVGGKLRTSTGNLLPMNDSATFPNGPVENDNEGRLDPATLFVSGDVRTNENVPLIALHTLLVREHNRLANQIAATNPSFTDEELYQHARRLLGATLQHITYSEYLPLLLGPNAIAGYTGYDPTIDPNESALFAVAAFRVGHTQLFSEVQRLDASGQSLEGGFLSLQNAFFTPQPIKNDGIEPYLRGLAASVAQEVDPFVIDDVRNFLFGPPGAGGMDLPALNIQRGRDMGLPSYNQARLDFGLPAVTSFAEITSDASVQAKLQATYETVDKIDVWVGGIAESHAPGAAVGTLFQRIIADQFRRTRDGDRFWYENSQFTESELSAIRGTTLRDLIIRNTSIGAGELPASVFTVAGTITGPAPAGNAGTGGFEVRTITGEGNNPIRTELGSVGEHLLTNFTLTYGDGISSPGGQDRPGARAISNGVNSQSESILNSLGATGFLVFWGQLIDHDLGLTPGGVSDTLRILGNKRPDSNPDDGVSEDYPFVAERMDLMLDHAVFPGVDNVIERPIYLPELDMEHGTTIDPNTTATVVTPMLPGAQLVVASHSLMDRSGMEYRKPLSITEVPITLTPAALPPGAIPDLVVTIQPADLVFTQPAPLSLPNRAGWAPGTEMDLWSINPVTGFFEDVGDMRVSSDGSVIETTKGGIRNSSWHYPAPRPRPRDTNNEPRNQERECPRCEEAAEGTSQVELHSGAVREAHSLVGYNSNGSIRQLSIEYNSERADPRPILVLGYNDVPDDSSQRLAGGVIIRRGDFEHVVGNDASGGQSSLLNHYWSIPDGGGEVLGSIQADLGRVPSGVYTYELWAGLLRPSRNATGAIEYVGSAGASTGRLVHVNSVQSVFGAGWGLAGLQELVENPDGTVLLIDGDGTELVFRAPEAGGKAYLSPAGDFSLFEKLGSGIYKRTHKDQTVQSFSNLRLASTVDRNGNETRYVYDSGRLVKIIDPVGRETTFEYTTLLPGARRITVLDPAGRATHLDVDSRNDLFRITDPDGSYRSFAYDDMHHLTGEVDARGYREQMHYGFAGRAEYAIRKDGERLDFRPLQTQGLYTPSATRNPSRAPFAFRPATAESAHIDGKGNVVKTLLDKTGQAVTGIDGEGVMPRTKRNSNNLVESRTSARGNVTSITYDDRGNPVAVQEILTTTQSQSDDVDSGRLYPFESFLAGNSPNDAAAGDFDGDGLIDLAVTLGDGTSVLFGNADGGFEPPIQVFRTSRQSFPVAADFDEDGVDDFVSIGATGILSLALGRPNRALNTQLTINLRDQINSVVAGDVNGDMHQDLILVGASTRLLVLQGNGDGDFRRSDDIRLDRTASALVVHDVNSDGSEDILVGAAGLDSLTLHLMSPSGVLDRVSIPMDGQLLDLFSAIAATDVNGDRQLDLVAGVRTVAGGAGSYALSVHIGIGGGRFGTGRQVLLSEQPYYLAVTDFDANGTIDVGAGYATRMELLLGNGEAAFPQRVSVPTPFLYSFSVAPRIADLNRDGRVDIISARSITQVTTILGTGAPGFPTFVSSQAAPANGGLRSLVYAKLDGNDDGYVVGTLENANSIVVQPVDAHSGALGAPTTFPVEAGPYALATGDFNEDGLLDIVTANNLGQNLSLLLRTPNKGFEAARPIPLANARGITVVDYNGDGHSDILACSYGTGEGAMFIGDGQGAFSKSSFTPAAFCTSLAVSDIDADGLLDIVTGHFNGDVFVRRGNGDLRFMRGSGNAHAIAIGHFNDDTFGDLVVADYSNNRVIVRFGTGNGIFGPDNLVDSGLAPSSIAVADFDGDGHDDIAVVHSRGPSFSTEAAHVTIILGTGTNSFDAPRSFSVAEVPWSFAIADVTGDGSQDILVAHHFSGAVSLLRSDDASYVLATRRASYHPIFGKVKETVDEMGRRTVYDLDPKTGNTRTIQRVMGQLDDAVNGEANDLVTRFTYTPRGLVDSVTDSRGVVTDYKYDQLGNVARITFAKGTSDEALETFEYDAAGNQTAMVDANGRRTEYMFDSKNRLVRTRDAAGNETQYRYDSVGNVVQVRDARGQITQYKHDSRNRLVQAIDSDAQATLYAYDNSDNLVSVTDPLGHAMGYQYDARGRQVKAIDADGGVTAFEYDLDNNLTAVIDPLGNRTRFVYDQRNRLVREIDPLGKAIQYSYDPADNLVSKTDRNGRKIRYEYDDAERLVKETWLNADGTTANVVNLLYDRATNLSSIGDSFSSLAFAYDERDRVLSVDTAGTPSAPHVVVGYTYDDVGNVLSVVDTIGGASGATTRYNYDMLDRLAVLTQSGPGLSDKRVDFSYNPLGQFDHIRRYKDLGATDLVVDSRYTYDSLNRLDVLDHRNATNQRLSFFDLDYDAASRITRITDIDGDTNYTYDDRDQLTGASHADPTNPDESYRYDANGNRLESHLHSTGYETDPNTANRLKSDGTYNYEYDDEGNTTRRTRLTGAEPDGSTVRDFTWDHRNRLISVTDKLPNGTATQVVRFTYDPLDRRISKSVDTIPTDAMDAAIMHFVYDREDVILDLLDADGPSGPAAPALTQRYLHGPAIDQLLAQDNAAGTVYWHLTDHLGTIRDSVDNSSGAVANHIKYDSYGNIVAQSDPAFTSRYQFTGREADTETALLYYRARYYNPSVGRFVRDDPIGFRGKDTNLYRYVGNAPQEFTDPQGMERIGVVVCIRSLFLIPLWYCFCQPGQFEIYGDPSPDCGSQGCESFEPGVYLITGSGRLSVYAVREDHFNATREYLPGPYDA